MYYSKLFTGRLPILTVLYWQNVIMSIMKSDINGQTVIFLRARITELRKEKGLSQVSLAKEPGVDCSTIAKYETGDRLPDIVMLCKLASFFGVSTDYLLGRTSF